MSFRWLILMVFLLPALCGSGQTDSLRPDFSRYDGLSLERVLTDLTDKYGVVFSYNPAALEGITAPAVPEGTLFIPEFLHRALEGSDLTFQIISNTYVLVERPKPHHTLRRHLSLIGVVRDVDSGESLPYATISVKGTNLRTTANSEGKFSLLDVPTDTSLVQVTYLGYAPVLVRVGSMESGPMIFALKRHSRQLPSVVVHARPEEMLEFHPHAGKFTFNARDISTLPNLGEADIFSALRRLPGMGSDGGMVSGLRIRGGGSGENLVMFDGIPIYHLDHFYGYFSAFNTPMIKHVQVYKGGFGAKYGGRTSGIVDIVGIDGNKHKPEIQVEANTMSIGVLGQLPLVENKVSLVAGFRRSFTDWWAGPTFVKMFNRLNNAHVPTQSSGSVDVFSGDHPPIFAYGDFNAKLSMKPSELDAVSLSFYSGTDRLDMRFDHAREGIRRLSSDNTEWGNTGGSAKWARVWDKRFSTSAILGISRYESSLDAVEIYYSGEDLFSSNIFEQRVAVDDRTIRLDNTLEISDHSKLEFGWWHTENTVTSQAQDAVAILRDSTIKGRVNAGYITMRHRMGAFQTELGLRANHYNRTDKIYPAPRWDASWRVHPHIELKASAGVHYQMMRRLNERSLYLSIPETWTLADPATVPVARSDQFQIEIHAAPGSWEIVLGGYHKYERGTAELPFPEFGTPTGGTDRLAIGGRRSIFGLEFLAEKTLKKHRLLFSYGFIHARSKYPNLNGGEYFRSPGVARHVFSGIYGYQHKRWEITAAQSWSYGMHYTPIIGTRIDSVGGGDVNRSVIPGPISSGTFTPNHRLDLSVHYCLPLKNGVLDIGLSVYNVYNHRSEEMIHYFALPRQDSEQYDLGQREVPGLGITPSAFLRIHFN